MSMDADAARTFTEDEMREYNPQPCEVCGQPTMQYEFEDTHDAHGLPRAIFVLTSGVCTNARCASNGGPEGPDGTAGTSDADGAVV